MKNIMTNQQDHDCHASPEDGCAGCVTLSKEIITEEELTDMFGEGGKEEVKEYYSTPSPQPEGTVEGIFSKCCSSQVRKYYNTRAPGREEEFICNACDKECDFYEPSPQPDWDYGNEFRIKFPVMQEASIFEHLKQREEMGEWVSKILSSYRDQVVKELEGMKKICEECGVIENSKTHLDYPDHTDRERGYNKALSDSLARIKKLQ